jgi:hypothetical protein
VADDDEPTPPGWYRQPDDPETLRWWDGDDWTDDTRPVPTPRVPAGEGAGALVEEGLVPIAEPIRVERRPRPEVGAPARTQPRRPGARPQPRPEVRAQRRPEVRVRDPRQQAGPRPRVHDDEPRPRHLDGERRPGRSGSRLVAQPSSATAQTALRIGVRAGLIAVLVAVLWIGFVQLRDADTAQAFVELTARVVDSCRESSTDGGTLRLAPMDFPRFGDQTFVAEVSGESPSGEAHGALVYLRKGNRVASVVTITFGDAGVNTELIEHLAQVVSHRMSTKPAIDATIDRGGGGSQVTLPGEDG